jgi:hypothetical protein
MSVVGRTRGVRGHKVNYAGNRDEANIPILQSHMEELERRLHRYRTHPGDLVLLEELQSRIENKKLIIP